MRHYLFRSLELKKDKGEISEEVYELIATKFKWLSNLLGTEESEIRFDPDLHPDEVIKLNQSYQKFNKEARRKFKDALERIKIKKGEFDSFQANASNSDSAANAEARALASAGAEELQRAFYKIYLLPLSCL